MPNIHTDYPLKYQQPPLSMFTQVCKEIQVRLFMDIAQWANREQLDFIWIKEVQL